MRNLFLSLAALSILLLGVTFFQLFKTSSKEYFARSISIGDLHGFEDTGPNANAFKELRNKINSKITSSRHKEHKNAVWVTIISFLVTALTGIATLISTIKAARNPDANPGRIVKIIAILTFFASLGNWGNSQFADARTKAIETVTNLKDMRAEFYSTYQQTPEDKKQLVIDTYNDKLNDL